MVDIAEQIKSKLERKELNEESEEMKEIQSVMFNMGMASNFSAQVNKDTSGKLYHQQLALELEKFLDKILDKFGGVIGLIDLFCMYNRARGTDLISTSDMAVAAEKLNQTSSKFMLKRYPSGVLTIQSKHFNEGSYYTKLAEVIKETGNGLTAVKLGEKLNVNVLLMRELCQAAEMQGVLCRDESFEGVQYFENRIMAYS